MSPPAPNLRQLFLRPGELFICREPSQVTTLLGSCVAVTMFSSRMKIGAICHALLPYPGASEPRPGPPPAPYKYVSLAIPAMLEVFRSHAVAPEEIEVKLFGGANVLVSLGEGGAAKTIGAFNIQLARQLLLTSNLRVKRCHVGGEVGRKLLFNTDTGEVLLKQFSHHGKAKNQSNDRR